MSFTVIAIPVAVNGQTLTVTSLPAVLFNGGSQTIVEGSVVWLYCLINSISPTLTVTWNKDGIPVVLDVPHVRVWSSTSATSSTFLLVVDNFQPSDDGTYQCTAMEEEGNVTTGTLLSLTGIIIMSSNLTELCYS